VIEDKWGPEYTKAPKFSKKVGIFWKMEVFLKKRSSFLLGVLDAAFL